MESKSYGFKSKKGNVASVTLVGDKNPDKKTLDALSTLVDLAFDKTTPLQTYPCHNCQGCGCTTCGGAGTLTY